MEIPKANTCTTNTSLNDLTNSTILTDKEIKELVETKNMIVNFIPESINKDKKGNKVLSYGLTSMGYDVTLSTIFAKFTKPSFLDRLLNKKTIIDPLNFNKKELLKYYNQDEIILEPLNYLLGHTNEFFNIPKDIMVICIGKSTLARSGLLINITPVEPGFSGEIVIEIFNATNHPIVIRANQGISQFIFFKAKEECEVGYCDRNGKYMNQTGITTSKG